jgi:hypothetical protein
MEKPKNLFFRGLNPKKVKIPRFALLIVSKSRNHPPPPKTDLEGWGGGLNWLPHIDVGEPLLQNHYFPTTGVYLVDLSSLKIWIEVVDQV